MTSNAVCVDANVAIAWLSYEEHSEKANTLRRLWIEQGAQMVGPVLFHTEIISVIRQQVYFKRMLPAEGEEALSICLNIPIEIIDGQEVYRSAWQLAKKFNLPVCYDMLYVAVAELEDCDLWTCDKRLVNSCRDKINRIRWVGDL